MEAEMSSTHQPTSPWSTEFLPWAFCLETQWLVNILKNFVLQKKKKFCASKFSIEFSTLWAEENIACLYDIIFSLYELDLDISQLSWQRVIQEVQYKRENVPLAFSKARQRLAILSSGLSS